jgi:hypothetical protein
MSAKACVALSRASGEAGSGRRVETVTVPLSGGDASESSKS